MNKKKYPIPATIVIRLNGDETTATIMGDEFKTSRITRTHAKRNPKDEYDAYIGARVALDRLFGKDFFEEHQEDDAPKKDKEEPRPRWKTGDKVIIISGRDKGKGKDTSGRKACGLQRGFRWRRKMEDQFHGTPEGSFTRSVGGALF